MFKNALLLSAAVASVASASPFRPNAHGRSLFVCGNGEFKCTHRGWWNVCLWGECACTDGYTKDFAGRCTVEPTCPTPSTQPDLNVDEFIRATWYSQKQQINTFQQPQQLYCVAATYEVEPDRKVPFFDGKVITAFNYANEGKVNGAPVNGRPSEGEDPEITLCARSVNEEASKLLVAPCFLPNVLAGDYWVLGAGPSPDNYEWAVVSAGKPTEKFADGCTTDENSGLWIFTRKQTDPEGVKAALAVLKAKGYATSQLVDIPQDGCTYDTAFIKPNVRA